MGRKILYVQKLSCIILLIHTFEPILYMTALKSCGAKDWYSLPTFVNFISSPLISLTYVMWCEWCTSVGFTQASRWQTKAETAFTEEPVKQAVLMYWWGAQHSFKAMGHRRSDMSRSIGIKIKKLGSITLEKWYDISRVSFNPCLGQKQEFASKKKVLCLSGQVQLTFVPSMWLYWNN